MEEEMFVLHKIYLAIQDIKMMVEEMYVFLKIQHVILVTKMTVQECYVLNLVNLVQLASKIMVLETFVLLKTKTAPQDIKMMELINVSYFLQNAQLDLKIMVLVIFVFL